MQGKSIVTYITAESEDGTQKEYKLIVYALPDNIKLSSVKVNGKEAEAVPTNKYETRINKEETSFEVYVIPEDPKVELIGAVKLEQNGNIINGDKAETDLNTQISRITGNKKTGGRITGTFYSKRSANDKKSEK